MGTNEMYIIDVPNAHADMNPHIKLREQFFQRWGNDKITQRINSPLRSCQKNESNWIQNENNHSSNPNESSTNTNVGLIKN